jgi:hypothetical protein
MAELFASGRLVDFILIVVVVEATVLLLLWRRARRGVAPADLLPNLCAGSFLVLALRAVLAGSGWITTSFCLAAAGLAHLIDIYRRWRR